MSTQTACGTETTRQTLTNKMGDKDGFFAGIGKVYVIDKPIGLKPTENSLTIDQSDLDALDNKERHYDAHIPEQVTMTFEMNASARQFVKQMQKDFNKRLPRLPRKLKKRVKKAYFIKYPKRIDRYTLNYAFALNNPHRARKVKMVAIPKDVLTKTDE